MSKKLKHKPYEERTDIERIESNWKKVRDLLKEGEWSSAITRAGTAAEIAANLAVRHELQEKRGLDKNFVNHLLKWANGLQGKLDKLLRPLHDGSDRALLIKELKKKAEKINEERNAVVHSGEFRKKQVALKIVSEAKYFIERLVLQYHPGFALEDLVKRLTRPSNRRR